MRSIFYDDFINLVKEKKGLLLLGLLFSVCSSILLIVPFVLIFEVIKIALSGTELNRAFIIKLFHIAFGTVLIRYVFAFMASFFCHKAAFGLIYSIRVRLTKHIGAFPMGFWNENGTSQVLKVVQNDVEAIEEYIGHQVPDGVSAFTLPFAILAYLYFINWKLAIFTSIPTILILIMFRLLTMGVLSIQDRKAMTQKYHKSIGEMNSALFEFVRGMPVIKTFNITAEKFSKLKHSIEDYRKTVTEWQKGTAPYRALIASLVFSGGLFILPASIYFLNKGSIEPITVLLFMILGTGCSYGLLKAMMIWTRMEFIKVGIERINALFLKTPMSEPKTPLIPKKYDIEIKNVSFRYGKDSPANVLDNVSMKLPEGSFNAFVGPSGAGKTTLINLIARMWETEKGSIRIGGKDLKDMGTKGVSEIIGTVFQDVYILTDTVASNISMGERVSREKIVKAAKAAACHDFIMKLPKGYDTIIGDGGEIHLSGGERQRISLARVILKNPPVILLDEATSYADAENEKKMQESFSRLMKNKTVVVVAHRLATIARADKIHVISEGRLTEEGNHNRLLQKNGIYSKMWNSRVKAKNWKLQEVSKKC